MSPRLSVCMIARDEARELEACLDSVAWADEIVVVVDLRSQDETEAIARSRATKVERRVYEGDIEQKRTCVGLASHDWVLLVDPDEVVSPELAKEIRRGIEGAQSGECAFEINRLTHHLGRWIRHGDFYPDWTVRVFRRSRSRWTGKNPHGKIEVEGRSVRLQGELWHRSYRDLADQVERIQFFSSEAARALHALGRKARVRDLVLRPPARFLRAYLLKQGFRDGVPGFWIAAATAFHVLLKYAKLWEMQRGQGPRSAFPPRARKPGVVDEGAARDR